MIAAHKGAEMTTEIIFWAMNILGGIGGERKGGAREPRESANLSQSVQNGSSKLLSSGVVGEKAH